MELSQLRNLVLLEYKREITIEKIGAKLVAKAKENREGTKVEEILDAIEKMDPTTHNQYVEWLCRQYIKGAFRQEDEDRVKQMLQRFENIKRRLDKRDINQYTYQALEDLMDKEFDVKLKDEEEEEDDDDADSKIEGLKILYKGPLGLLATPTTVEASCKIGAGTKWCTAATKGNNMFASYTRHGPLIVWRDKSGEKYQFHFASGQFMNDKDRPISKELFQEFRSEHPVLKRMFQKFENQLLESENNRGIMSYASRLGGEWPEAEKFILEKEKADIAYDWAISVVKGRWEKGEPIIIKDPVPAARYAINILKGRWKPAEKTIAGDDTAASLYANAVRRGRNRGEESWK